MAKDDNTNDKDQDDFFGDDEDFGLPELDYEALDDDDDSGDSEPAAEETPVEEPKREEPKEEELPEIDDSSLDSDMIDDDDIPDQISDEELEASLGDDDSMDLDDAFDDVSMDDAFDEDSSLDDAFDDDTSLDDAFEEETLADNPEPEPVVEADTSDKLEEPSDESVDEFYEEESFDDFDASSADEGDSGEEIPDSVFDSDVLDEDEFAQFEKELMDTEEENVAGIEDDFQSDYSETPTENKSKFAKVVIIGVLIFAVLGAAFMWGSSMFGDEEEKPVAENTQPKQPAKTPEKKPEEKPASQETESQTPANNASNADNGNADNNQQSSNTQQASNRPVAQPVTATPGTINSLSERTGNFYIVIGSFLDGDMAMDYANELSGAGKSPSIIPPFGNAVTHRVAIAGYSSLAESQQAVNGFKAEYGEDIWILRY